MKRRGFLGLLGGAAVAGPAMAKEAVASLADLEVSNIAGSAITHGWDYASQSGGSFSPSLGPSDWASRSLEKLLGRTAAQHAHLKRRVRVTTLDPDLGVARSFALHQKIRLQRERNYQRSLEEQRGELEAIISKLFGDPEQPEW